MKRLKGFVTPGHPLARHFKGFVAASPSEVTVMVRAFRAAVGTYVDIPGWTANGDFHIKLVAATTLSDTIRMLCGSAGSDSYIHINSDNSITLRCNGVPIRSDASVITDDELSLIEFVRIGTDITGYIHGNEIASGTVSGPMYIDRLGSAMSGFYWDGPYYRAELSEGSDNRQYSDFSLQSGVVPNVLDLTGNTDGTLFNGADGSVDTYTLNTATNPDQLENSDQSSIIPVAPGVTL